MMAALGSYHTVSFADLTLALCWLDHPCTQLAAEVVYDINSSVYFGGGGKGAALARARRRVRAILHQPAGINFVLAAACMQLLSADVMRAVSCLTDEISTAREAQSKMTMFLLDGRRAYVNADECAAELQKLLALHAAHGVVEQYMTPPIRTGVVSSAFTPSHTPSLGKAVSIQKQMQIVRAVRAWNSDGGRAFVNRVQTLRSKLA